MVVTLNYFTLFGLEPTFTIEQAKLSAAFQSLQKTVHPDRFAHASEQEKLIAVQKSAQINDGFQTLKNPITRSEHLLKLRGVEMPSEQASFSDPEFLMAQMELREMLEEIRFSDDKDAAFFAASEQLDLQYSQLLLSLEAQLYADDQEQNNNAAETTRKLKFYRKLHDELDRLEEQLFD